MKRTILIVDDDASVRDSLKKLLSAEEYRALTARDSAEAIELFTSEKIDLVVMDVNLGEDDGWETFARMAALNDSVPVVIVTAGFGQRDRAIAAGAEALIEKPMDVPLFLEVVAELLSGSRHRARKGAGGNERYCLYVNRGSEALRRDLESRCVTPLNMSWFDRLQLVPARPEN